MGDGPGRMVLDGRRDGRVAGKLRVRPGGLAAWRLRPAYRARLDARPSRVRGWLARAAGLRGRARPPCGDDPIGWKEAHAPESAGMARLVVLIGLVILTRMMIGQFQYGMPHLNYVMDELFRYGMDLGPNGNHHHARNELNDQLNEMAAVLAAAAMAASALLAASGVAGERGRGTWDGLLATPIDRASILRAKMLGAAWSVRALLGMVVFLYLVALASTALHPAGFVLATASLAVFVCYAVALGTYVSVRSRDAGRAIARTATILLAVELAPVAALAPFIGGYAASLVAAPRLMLELPLSRIRVHAFTQAIGIEPTAITVILGVVTIIVGGHALAAWLLTRGAARRITREGG